MINILQKCFVILGLALGSALIVAGHSSVAQSHFMKHDTNILPKLPSRG
ncbi:MAG: hypothetical protein JNK21_14020 [Rhodospirillaceae bacterium]|nr:hypothetical protein [Rhodospirillaceae bacterium]